MTTTTDTLDDLDVFDFPYDGCGPDCIYIDGACRCYHCETVPSDFEDERLNNLQPPF